MSRRQRIHETVVLFMVGDHRFAISANTVEEICELGTLTPLSAGCGRNRVARSTFDRRGKRYLAVDAAAHFHIPESVPQHILVLRGADVGVLIGSIDRMHEINELYSLPRALSGEEQTWYRGLALVAGQIVPLVEPASFLPGGTTRANALYVSKTPDIGEAISA